MYLSVVVASLSRSGNYKNFRFNPSLYSSSPKKTAYYANCKGNGTKTTTHPTAQPLRTRLAEPWPTQVPEGADGFGAREAPHGAGGALRSGLGGADPEESQLRAGAPAGRSEGLLGIRSDLVSL